MHNPEYGNKSETDENRNVGNKNGNDNFNTRDLYIDYSSASKKEL